MFTKDKKAAKFLKRAAVAIGTAACLFCLFLPLPRKISNSETYRCVWADGSITEESYSSAYQSLVGIDGEEVVLSRNGLTGRVKSEAGRVYETLQEGSLAELLRCSPEGTRIDSAALYRTFINRAWYDGSYYVWTGAKIKRVTRAARPELVVLSGRLSASVLRESGAKSVYLRAGAEVQAGTFVGSGVENLYAQLPYEVSDGALYLNTVGGKRLVAALGGVRELAVLGDIKFIAEGALLACDDLVALTLPFLGSAESRNSAAYKGELAHLFSDGREYRVPETLVRVKITGGSIVPFAFYACSGVKEIDACGVPENDISQTAFTGIESLEVLHTPKKNVVLTGDFTSYTADCGCTVYHRIYSQK